MATALCICLLGGKVDLLSLCATRYFKSTNNHAKIGGLCCTKYGYMQLDCPSVKSWDIVITFAVGVRFQIWDQFWITQPKLHGAWYLIFVVKPQNMLIQLQLDCWSATRTRTINLPTNQKSCDTFETTVGKLSARRIQIFPLYFCLGIILKVILNNFQNNA